MTRPTLLARHTDGTPDWQALRQTGIGGSEIAAILRISPYQSRYALWRRKHGDDPGEPDSARFRRGHYLEPGLMAYAADQTGLTIRPGKGTYAHPQRPWQRANPDSLAYLGPRARRPVAIVEGKTDADGSAFGEDGTDKVPPYYRAQGIWYAGVFGVDRVIFSVLTGRLQLKLYDVPFDRDEHEWMVEQGVEFLRSLEADEVPDTDADRSTYESIRRQHPQIDTDVEVELPAELAVEYVLAREWLDDAERAERTARNAVAELLGSAHRAVVGPAGKSRRTIAQRQAKGDGLPYLVAARKMPPADEVERLAAAADAARTAEETTDGTQ